VSATPTRSMDEILQGNNARPMEILGPVSRTLVLGTGAVFLNTKKRTLVGVRLYFPGRSF
jgi:hypothetical protein